MSETSLDYVISFARRHFCSLGHTSHHEWFMTNQMPTLYLSTVAYSDTHFCVIFVLFTEEINTEVNKCGKEANIAGSNGLRSLTYSNPQHAVHLLEWKQMVARVEHSKKKSIQFNFKYATTRCTHVNRRKANGQPNHSTERGGSTAQPCHNLPQAQSNWLELAYLTFVSAVIYTVSNSSWSRRTPK